jgi:hypothetical protein
MKKRGVKMGVSYKDQRKCRSLNDFVGKKEEKKSSENKEKPT